MSSFSTEQNQKLGALLARLLTATRAFAYVAERDPKTGVLSHFEIASPDRAQEILPLAKAESYSAAFLAAILPEDLPKRQAALTAGAHQLTGRFRCRDLQGTIHTIHEEATCEGNQLIGVLSLLPKPEDSVFPAIEPLPTSSNPRLLRRRTTTLTAAELEAALAQDQLTLAYQFQLAPAEQRLISAEVFLRWRHPQQGLLFPARFLSLVEEAGLLGAIGHWTLQAACAQQRRWAEAGFFLPLALNVSTSQLLDPGFAQSLPDAALLLELPESALHHGSPLEPGLRALAERGFPLGIDNAGLELLAPKHLKSLPIHYLKLSGSLVQDLDAPESAQKARCLLQLGRDCNLTMIADGVETPQQAQWLKNEGYEQLQGYLYSRPVAAEALEEILRSGRFCLPDQKQQRAA